MLKKSVLLSVCATIAFANISATQAQTVFMKFPPKGGEVTSDSLVFVKFPSKLDSQVHPAHAHPVASQVEIGPNAQNINQFVNHSPVVFSTPPQEIGTVVPISTAASTAPAVAPTITAPPANTVAPEPIASAAPPAWTAPDVSTGQPVCFSGG